ncbi:YvaD family protein [soil metagenome]
MSGPSRPLTVLMTATDVAFLLYWAVSGLDAAGVLHLPAGWMYAHHDDPRVVAWNWSFLPVDLGFSLTGLFATTLARRGDALWRPLAIVSLTLTVTAGGMAVAYWALTGEIDPVWFGSNLLLVLWPVPFLVGLVRTSGSPPA